MKTNLKTLAFLSLILLAFLTGCKETEGDPGVYEFEGKGKITELKASYWMYGTHTITVNNKLYALHSTTIDLYNYHNSYVTIWGNKVQGYPVDGGPEYIDVKRIKR